VVDLYGYLSMAVATVQAQSSDIDALKREVDDLRKRLNEMQATSAGQSTHSVKRRVAAHGDPAQR
jgi:capsule polysaccharide export protein KpsE/RkpR